MKVFYRKEQVGPVQRASPSAHRDQAVAQSLPYTSGSMVAAAHYAVQHKEVVCSPTYGFHHAGFSIARFLVSGALDMRVERAPFFTRQKGNL